jgi:hypothetical protein
MPDEVGAQALGIGVDVSGDALGDGEPDSVGREEEGPVLAERHAHRRDEPVVLHGDARGKVGLRCQDALSETAQGVDGEQEGPIRRRDVID